MRCAKCLNVHGGEKKWQLVVSRRFYYVIPSEYMTKEITSALLCLITDQEAGEGGCKKVRKKIKV